MIIIEAQQYEGILLIVPLGNEDTFCRLDAVVKSTEYCDNYLVKIIENAGHWPHQEKASEFNRVILKFLVGAFTWYHELPAIRPRQSQSNW